MDEKENKYVFDINELSDKEDEDTKAARRKKHKQGRVIAWLVLVLIIFLLAGGAAYGVYRIVGSTGNAAGTVESVSVEPDEVKEVISNLVGEEEEVVVTPPEDLVVEPTDAPKETSLRL